MRQARKLFLLSGQSNMAGRGDLALVPDYAHKSRIFTLSYANRWMPSADPIGHECGDEIDKRFIDRKAGAGPSMAFANRLAEHYPDLEVGLVPTAKGGTYIDEWRPGPKGYYAGLIERAKLAEKTGEIAGMIWYQGENECVRKDHVISWPEKFTQLVRYIRHDLAMPNLPVIMTILGPNRAPWRYPFWDEFVDSQKSMTLPEGVITVSANDLQGLADDPHLITPDYVLLGQRYGDAMAEILEAKTETLAP